MPEEQFLALANARYGNRYIYDMRHYHGSSVPISIICPAHGSFRCYPHNHVGAHGQECRVCRRERRARGITRGCVYLLYGVNSNGQPLAKIGHTENTYARFPSHDSSDQVKYTLQLEVPQLTYKQRIELENRLKAGFNKLRRPVRHRREVFVLSRNVAVKLFRNIVQRWREQSGRLGAR
jgi:hypothetical protein